MSTIDFNKSKEQKNEVVANFEFSSSYLELSITRMQVLGKYLDNIMNEYLKHSKSIRNINGSDLKKIMSGATEEKPLAPGLPGCHTARFEILKLTMFQVATEFQTFSDFIKAALLEPINNFTLNAEAKLKGIVSKYNELKKFRKTCKGAAKSSLKDFNNAAQAAEKAYKELNTVQRENKINKIEKATKALKDSCKNYQKAAAALRINIGKFNAAHDNFIKFSQDSIKNMNELHPERVRIAKSIINDYLVPSMTTFANNYRDVQGWFEQSAVPWEPGFKKFVNSKGIVRTMIKPQDFVTHDGVFYPAHVTQIDAPILIGTITKDFSSDEPFKMSVTKGQKVGLYESLCHEWVLARDAYKQKRYIPSSCVTIEKSRIALVRTAQLVNNDGALHANTGDLLFVVDENDHDYICKDLNGVSGSIPKYAVFIESQ